MRPAHCALAAAILTACGGGSGGGDEQKPDPVVVELPIAYVKRPLPTDGDGNPMGDDALDPAAFNPGAELILRDRASAGAPELVITAGVFGEGELYDVKDLAASSDGDKLLFSMRAPEIEGLDEDDQPKWNIWEYEISTRTLRRIIQSDILAEAGHDVAPQYLPDGRIVFSSTRQRRSRAILLDESKPQYSALDEDRRTEAFLLHVMDAEGANIEIEQITYNQSHDLQPSVLDSGEILFVRWDNAGNSNSLSLYKVDPTGHNLSFHYGYHSQNTGTNDSAATFLQPQEMPDGRILVSLRPTRTDSLGGDMVVIDAANYTEIDQPAIVGGGTGPAQKSLAVATVTTDDTPSPHGHFSSVYPLYDGTNRLLVSWSQCRLNDPATGQILPCTEANLAIENVEEADPFYGIWIYNLDDGTQRPVVTAEEGVMYTEAIALEPKRAPTHIAPKEPVPRTGLRDGSNDANEVDEALVAEGVGVVHIRSVYDFDGVDTSPNGIAAMADPLQTATDARPARFLRIIKAVPMPDRDVLDFDNSAFGASQGQLMREILGYVPIEPDGSVKFKVPADIAFAFSVVDAEGKRLDGYGRHQNWLQVRPGEERECSGCHTANSEVPHGRIGAGPESVNSGALVSGGAFPNTNPEFFADLGETMAEVYARIRGIRAPDVNLVFNDEWVEPAVTAPDLTYAALGADAAKPASDPCQIQWNSLCRVVINYPVHIQPLWEKERPVLDDTENNKCTGCHNTANAFDEANSGYLDLSNTASNENADHLESYRELLFDDSFQQRDADGELVFVTDENGEFVLDENGDMIPIIINVPGVMSTAGAKASAGFFAPFAAGGIHEGYLTPSELKLIAEWLDIGAQYYNNPFDAPTD